LEKELIRLNIEKRNKEFERECISRMTEANALCNKMNIPKAFSVINCEVKFYFFIFLIKIFYILTFKFEGLKCQILDKNTNKITEMDLKGFNFEYKKIKKIESVGNFVL